MEKTKLDELATELKKEFDYLLIAFGERNHCMVTADLLNLRMIEIDEKEGVEIK